jgi:PAS domain S-box-containing protein
MNNLESDISNLIRALERLQLAESPCFIYRTSAELFTVVSPFIRIGLSRNEKCLYIVYDDEPEVILEFLEKGGIDTSSALDRGALEVVKAAVFYPENDPYDPEHLHGIVKQAVTDARAAGFDSLRLVNDMKWIHDRISGTEQLVDHVAQMNDFYAENNIVVLRLYNSTRLTSQTLLDVIRIHPKVIFSGVVCTNYSYRSREDLSRPRSADFEMEYLLRGMLDIEKNFEDLQTENVLLKAVVENTPDIVFLKDLNGRYLLINQAGAAFLGKKIEDVLGLIDSELFTQEEAEKINALDRQVVDCGKPLTIEKALSANGVTRVFLATKGAYCDQKGNIIGTFGVSRDITERREAEEALRESEKRFRSYFELGLIGMAITSPAKEFIEVNDKICEILGYERGELMRMTWGELTNPDDLAADLANYERVLTGEIDGYSMDKRFIRNDGNVIYTTISVKCLRRADGTVDYLVALLQDITYQKQAEGKILAYQDQLRSLASELVLTEERERRQIATALHDQIGQTLALVNIKLGALREIDGTGGLSDSIDDIREMVNSAIRKSQSLIFEISPPVLYELGLDAALSSLAEYFSKEHGIPIDFSDDKQPKPLSRDIGVLLFQSVRELLVNAVKHSRARRVTISSRRQESQIRILVEDDGIGFNVEENGVPKGPGHGFGLFSIRERIRTLGGSIEIESNPGCGARVTLTGPLMTSKKQKEAPE